MSNTKTHTLRHALYPVECACTRAERLASDCVICGRRAEHFTPESTAKERDTCSKPCWQALLRHQREA